MTGDCAWFAAKRHGYGASWPIAWQGWAMLGLYLAATVAAAILLDRVWSAAVVVLGAVALLLVASRTTRGGWRWRED